MKLADMLVYSDIEQLNRIADSYHCSAKSNSKNELIQEILSAFYRQEKFEEMVHNLEVEDLRFINSLLFDQKQAFSLEELTARASQSVFDENQEKRNVRERITKLKHLGLLFNGYSMQTKHLFSIPEDIKLRFSHVLKTHFCSKLRYVKEVPVFREESGLLAEDLIRFLKFVKNEPIRLSAEGFIYKRQLHQLLEQFTVQEQPVQRGQWRFGYGRKIKEYPHRFSLIYDYSYYNGFIKEGDELNLTKEGEQFMECGKAEPSELYRFYLKLYKHPVKNLQALVYWMVGLTDRWVVYDTLKDVLIPYVRPFYYDNPENIIEKRVMKMLMHLGILRVGEHPEHGRVVRASSQAHDIISGIYINEQDEIRFKRQQ